VPAIGVRSKNMAGRQHACSVSRCRTQRRTPWGTMQFPGLGAGMLCPPAHTVVSCGSVHIHPSAWPPLHACTAPRSPMRSTTLLSLAWRAPSWPCVSCLRLPHAPCLHPRAPQRGPHRPGGAAVFHARPFCSRLRQKLSITLISKSAQPATLFVPLPLIAHLAPSSPLTRAHRPV